METVSCDLCGSSEYDDLFKQKDLFYRVSDEEFHMVRCRQCGLHYLNPRPTVSEMTHHYPDDYGFYSQKSRKSVFVKEKIKKLFQWAYFETGCCCKKATARLILSPFKYLPFVKRKYLNLLVPKINSYFDLNTPQRILDIGCGSGSTIHLRPANETLVALCAAGWEVYGIEVSQRARDILKSRGIQHVFPDFVTAELKDDYFDVIRMNWSFEHVHHPTLYLSECKRVLKPGGKLIISVPNYDGIVYKLFPHCVELPVHVYYFDTRTFKKYCDKLDYKIVAYQTFSYLSLFLEALNLMLPELYRYYCDHIDEAIHLNSFLQMMGKMDRGDDMTFCLTK
ncbi:MAG: class I SAM-dependent methyltransferase [Deltaproteobacteria bacterium]|nr:class I SAM-dependent methyltransferase [Deltaproteobacteria bacterium]